MRAVTFRPSPAENAGAPVVAHSALAGPGRSPLLLCAVMAISGCASRAPDDYCTKRTAERCIQWEFKPSKEQSARFVRNGGVL